MNPLNSYLQSLARSKPASELIAIEKVLGEYEAWCEAEETYNSPAYKEFKKAEAKELVDMENKTAIQKLITWWDKEKAGKLPEMKDCDVLDIFINKARSLAAEEAEYFKHTSASAVEGWKAIKESYCPEQGITPKGKYWKKFVGESWDEVSKKISRYCLAAEESSSKTAAPVNLIELKLWVIRKRNCYTKNDPFFNGFMVALCDKIDELTTKTAEAGLVDKINMVFKKGGNQQTMLADISKCITDYTPAAFAPVNSKQKTAADMAEPVGIVVEESVKHGRIGHEILIKPTHDITLPIGRKVYLHPEGNETVCDMCEVLTKLNELSAPVQVEPLTVITVLCKRAFETSKAHGWKHDNDGQAIALMHSELSEALEAMRKPEIKDEHLPHLNPIGLELADVLIRVFDFCGARGIDLATCVKEKMDYNDKRPMKHGGKKF